MADVRYRFHGRYVAKDPSGYYHARWDKATPVSIVAATKAEASKKLWALLGDPPRSNVWSVIWDRIEDESTPDGGLRPIPRALFDQALSDYRQAWHAADAAGREGERSREGVLAAMESLGIEVEG